MLQTLVDDTKLFAGAANICTNAFLTYAYCPGYLMVRKTIHDSQ